MTVHPLHEDEDLYPEDHPAVLASLHALTLGRRSWEAGRDECYAWLDVRQKLDPGAGSNTGQRNICWMGRVRQKPYYRIALSGPWGVKTAHMAAPGMLTEARTSPLLQRAIEKRDELAALLMEEHGAALQPQTWGVTEEFRRVLASTDAGREHLRKARSGPARHARYAVVAESYEPTEWSPNSSVTAHVILYKHPERLDILRRGVTTQEAQLILGQYVLDGPSKRKPLEPLDLMRPLLRRQVRKAIEAGLDAEEVWVLVDDVLCDVFASQAAA
ncbi:MAG: hypothetical protein WKF96_01275 [Solirubrobacteraceae bacterium]